METIRQSQFNYRRFESCVQFGDEAGEAGNAVAVHRCLRTIFQIFDAIAPICCRKRFLRPARDYAFKMNEFAFENVVVHCLNPPSMAGVVRSRRRSQSDTA